MDISLLKQLSKDQISFAGKFLESVFADRKTNLDTYTNEQLDTIIALISTSAAPVMKLSMYHALAETTLHTILPKLQKQDRFMLFEKHNPLTLLENLFKKLPEHQQSTVLDYLFNTDKTRYTALKRLFKDNVTLRNGIIITQESALKQFMEKEKHRLLDLFENPKASYTQVSNIAQKFSEKYDPEALEMLCTELITTFNKKNIGLTNPESFSIYLKFFYFIDPFVGKYTELARALRPLLDTLIVTLSGMPSEEWVIKVLNQLPQICLQTCLKQLKSYETLPQFEKRTLYSKLLKEIKVNCFSEYGENIRTAFSKI